MNKYQNVMEHVKVDDEMKKRILQNVAKELGDEKKQVKPKAKVIPFQRYAAIAATFAVLLVGSYAVIQTTGDIKNTAETASMSAEPAMEEAASMTEAPAMEAEAPSEDNAMTEDAPSLGESAVAHATLPESLTGQLEAQSGKAEDYAQVEMPEVIMGAQTADAAPLPMSSPRNFKFQVAVAIVLSIVCLSALSGIIALIIVFVRKKKR